jgi:hypothetical protein
MDSGFADVGTSARRISGAVESVVTVNHLQLQRNTIAFARVENIFTTITANTHPSKHIIRSSIP